MAKTMHATIPVPREVARLSEIFRSNRFDLYGVGGFVRDFLISQEEGEDFRPKDVDLATDATPREIGDMLDRAGVRNFEKGESFGVWVAHMNGNDFEIATFRTDGEYKDGRHPEGVEWTTPDQDYRRRDLTINALYYRLPVGDEPGEIIDYGDGVGFEDIRERRVRPVGSPHHRFAEDKLRVLRAVRFHHRFNDDYISNKVDYEVVKVIREFRELRKHGISGPRIMMEFLTCLRQARSIKKLVFDLNWLQLFDEIFPDLLVESSHVEHFDHPALGCVEPAVVIAWLLRYNSPKEARQALNRLCYPGDVFEDVEFLLDTMPLLMPLGSYPPGKPVENRDEKLSQVAVTLSKRPHRRGLLCELSFPLSQYAGFDQDTTSHLIRYEPTFYDGLEVMERYSIPQGPELGKKIRSLQTEDYRSSRSLFQG